MSNYIAAIDQGTTSTRCIVFDRRGEVITLAQREHQQIYPQPGWVEHDAMEIWRNTQHVIAQALAAGKLQSHQIAGVGITNQRETTLLWDRRTGVPLHNALVWQDTRVAKRVAAYTSEGGQDRFRSLTGLPLATYFSAMKLQWLLDEVPDARARADRGELMFGTMDSWLTWNLTGGPNGGLHLTDVTNASRTQLLNLTTLQWDPQLLEVFRIPASVLPRIAASSEIYGKITSGPLASIPIAGILGDQHAALVGQACFLTGDAKNTYGTGCFMLMNTGTKPVASKAGLITTVAYQFGREPAMYALEGSIAITGALVQWMRDSLGLIATSAEIESLAAAVPDNGDVYFVPAFSGLYAPHWKDSARGVIVGLTRFANKHHLARAVLEATAYQTLEVLEAMRSDANITSNELRVDGGMVDNELLMQFQSDILDMSVVRPRITETTALGAAYAAGLAVGYWLDLSDLKANWQIAKRWSPSMQESERAHRYARWQKAVTRSLDWAD